MGAAEANYIIFDLKDGGQYVPPKVGKLVTD
jgi:hypothetical protein